jgi:DNA-binding response OmpR family regulator
MSHTILIIDDELTTLKLVKMVLQRAGYRIITATNGSEGLRKVEECDPDLVLLDLVLPGLDGFQVCRELRQNPKTLKLPVIIFSGLNRPAEQRLAFEVGGDDFLTKPIRLADLLDKVRSALYFTESSPKTAVHPSPAHRL